ncbi:MAG: NAD(P)H-dependent oxidoreductase subunit E [Candidatus Aminicenantales bacterium]
MAEDIESIVSEFESSQKELIHILHRINEAYGHIPPQAISRISRHLRISESEIYGVLTFYKSFSLEPRGKYAVTVCMGTACHVRGGVQIVEELERKLGIKVGHTRPDRKFSLETVNCLGCCAIGPVVVVNGKYYSQVSIKKIDSILKDYRE